METGLSASIEIQSYGNNFVRKIRKRSEIRFANKFFSSANNFLIFAIIS